MKIKQKRYENLVLVVSIINCVKLYFYENRTIEILSLIASFLILSYLFLRSNLLRNKKVTVMLACVGGSLLLTAVINGGAGAALNYVCLILSSLIFTSYGVRKSFMKKLFCLTGVALLLFLLLLNKRPNYSTYIFSTVFNTQINSNMVGIIAAIAFFCLFCFSSVIKEFYVRLIVQIAVTIICSYYVIVSDCRSAMLAIIVFFICYLFKKKTIKQKKFKNIVMVSQICSILFVLVYLYAYKYPTFATLQLLGKSLYSGRQIVWGSAWDVALQYPLIGSGGAVELLGVAGTHTTSAHNTVMSLLYMFGFIPTVFYFVFMGKKYDKFSKSEPCRLNQFAVLGTLVITVFETFYMESYLGCLAMLFFMTALPQNYECINNNKEKT